MISLLLVVHCEVCWEAHAIVLRKGRKLHLSLPQKRTSQKMEDLGSLATWIMHGVEQHHYFF